MKKVAILGSTGSIGTQALEIVRENHDIEVTALSCNKNIKLLEKQAREFKPELICVGSIEDAKTLKTKLSDTNVRIVYGMEGLIEVATEKSCNIVLTAIVGMIGIRPTIAAIRAGKDIALANKETLVCAGDIIMPLSREYGVKILPVDSEHSAIFQSLQGNENNKIKKIILTASGGPFFEKKREELSLMRAKDALCHPNWNMGNKITIDSASLVNKGLEVIEACHLFGVCAEDINVVIHRESILHSAIEYEDGAIMGQMGLPDMRLPIAYALFYPDRRPITNNRLSLCNVGNLSFYTPDFDTFYGLKICIEAASRRGNMPAIVNAANEIAVEKFLNDEIGFLDIYDMIKKSLELIPYKQNPKLEDILGIYTELQEILK